MNNKYCSLYIVRHGETDWNVKRLLQGQTDIPLNKTGKIQAEKLAKSLKDIEFAMIFSSDLLRAKRTAEIIALEKKIAVRTTKVLRERKFGRFEGMSWENKEFQALFDKFLKLSAKQKFKTTPYEGNESDEELMSRFIPFIREASIAHLGKNVLVVTHGGVMRAFLNHLASDKGKEIQPGSIENTAYIRLFSDGVDFFIKETSGIIYHLDHDR